jgi:hypothetical protein
MVMIIYNSFCSLKQEFQKCDSVVGLSSTQTYELNCISLFAVKHTLPKYDV